MKEIYIESIKEFLRVVVLSIIPVLVDSLSTGEVELRTLFIVGSIAGLRFIDKLLHSYGVDTGSKTLKRGLTQF